MNKEILEAVTGEVRELLEAGSCCKEAKDAAPGVARRSRHGQGERAGEKAGRRAGRGHHAN